MKKAIVFAVASLALVSAAAYAQMQHDPHGPGMQGSGPMMEQMPHGTTGQGMMGQGMMREGMMGKGMMREGMGMRHGGMSGMHGDHAKGDQGPSSLAFQAINLKMHEAMEIAYTGNADVDFVRGMIPHHQGAIDMAKTVIAFGNDPAVKQLAEGIIKAQESEIALMQEWLKKSAR